MALGATAADIRMVMTQGAVQLGLGLALGPAPRVLLGLLAPRADKTSF